jgi:hypothetical protein
MRELKKIRRVFFIENFFRDEKIYIHTQLIIVKTIVILDKETKKVVKIIIKYIKAIILWLFFEFRLFKEIEKRIIQKYELKVTISG